MDASVAFLALIGDRDARRWLADGDVNLPHLADSELTQTLRRHVATGALTASAGSRALDAWARLELRRHGARHLLGRIWALRETVTAYDATYVALAEALDCPLVTADRRLADAPGPTCAMVVVGS